MQIIASVPLMALIVIQLFTRLRVPHDVGGVVVDGLGDAEVYQLQGACRPGQGETR